MAGLLTARVLLDNGTGTFPHDITDKALLADGYSFDRGRGDWDDAPTAGSLSLTLNNSDGRFSPGSTVLASPSPIVVDQRIRLLVGLVANTTFETDVTGYTGSSATLARSTAQAHAGVASMSMTATASATMTAVDSGSGTGGIPVAASTPYMVAVWARAAATARVVQLRVDWWDSAGVFISTSVGTGVSDATGSWTLIDEEFTSPSNAAYARRQVLVISPVAAEVHYVDDFTLETYRFTGYVKSWPVSWPATVPTFSTVQVTATCAQARAERRILRSVVEEEILRPPSALALISYLRLSEAAGSAIAIDSSNYTAGPFVQQGAGAAVSFGTGVGPGTDDLTAAIFTTGGKYLAAAVPNPNSRAVRNFAAWFLTSTGGTIFRFDSSSTPGDYAELTVAGGVLVYKMSIGGVVSTCTGTVNVADGLTHSVALIISGASYAFRIDGATTDGSAGIAATTTLNPTDTGTLYVGGSPSGPTFSGTLAHVVLYDSASDMTSASADTLAASGLTGFAGESDTARITRLAGYAGIPVGTLDTSLTNVPFTDFTGRSAWDCIQEVADAALGVAFVDGTGSLDFHNRNRAPTKTVPDLTITADYLTDAPTPTQDDQQIINYLEATATATGVPQVARNTLSELGNGTATNPGHGRYDPGPKTYLVQTDAEALDRANRIVAYFAEPTTRYGTLTINLYRLTVTQQQAVIAAVDVDTWLRITTMPSQTTGGTTADVVIEGYSEHMDANSWTLTLNVVSRSLFTALILDNATYGVLDSARLYV